jgi:predicted acylesterase/phospholipase RssA
VSEFEQTHSSGDPTKDYTCSRDYHLFANAPKRLLALDGGGLRGAISVAFLERIEKVLDDHFGRQIRLGDFFDLVGGTSTGAIIAGAIALGYRASEIKTFTCVLHRMRFAGA